VRSGLAQGHLETVWILAMHTPLFHNIIPSLSDPLFTRNNNLAPSLKHSIIL
jgi:hypothetical protein